MTVQCRCRCHDAWAGNRAAAMQLARLPESVSAQDLDAPVDGSDMGVREAAVACDRCRDRHCAALVTPRQAPRERTPWVDPPPPPPNPPMSVTDGSDDGC